MKEIRIYYFLLSSFLLISIILIVILYGKILLLFPEEIAIVEGMKDRMDDILHEISAIGIKFLDTTSLDDTYKIIVSEAIRLAKGNHGSIFLEKNGIVERVYATDSKFFSIPMLEKGNVHAAFIEKKSFVVHEKRLWKANKKFRDLQIHTAILIPLFYEKKSLGAVSIYCHMKKKFSQKQLHAFTLLGAIASLAIQKSLLGQEKNKVLEDLHTFKETEHILERINKAGLQLLLPQSLHETYKTIVTEATSLVDGDNGAIALAEGNALRRVYSSIAELNNLPMRKKGNHYKSFLESRAIVVHAKDFGTMHGPIKKRRIKSVIFIPLSYRNKTIGVMNIRSLNDQQFTSKELEILKLFGSIASLAIRKAQLYDETKKSLELRNSFLEVAAHELRTPLTSIHGYVQLLHSKLSKQDTAEGRWVRELMNQSNRMTSLIQALLQVNRIRTGELKLNFHQAHLLTIINDAIQRFHEMHPKRKVDIRNTLRKEDDLICDNSKLIDVLVGILDNAAKFSSGKTKIEITLTYKRSKFLVQIRDRGRGITTKDMPLVFEGFYKGADNFKSGLGVGLLLAKHIVEAHRGTIQMVENPQGGTIVEIALPLVQSIKIAKKHLGNTDDYNQIPAQQ